MILPLKFVLQWFCLPFAVFYLRNLYPELSNGGKNSLFWEFFCIFSALKYYNPAPIIALPRILPGCEGVLKFIHPRGCTRGYTVVDLCY